MKNGQGNNSSLGDNIHRRCRWAVLEWQVKGHVRLVLYYALSKTSLDDYLLCIKIRYPHAEPFTTLL